MNAKLVIMKLHCCGALTDCCLLTNTVFYTDNWRARTHKGLFNAEISQHPPIITVSVVKSLHTAKITVLAMMANPCLSYCPNYDSPTGWDTLL